MSDYFNCPRCGYAPKPSNDRAQEQGVCADCWTDFYMEEWYEADRSSLRRRIKPTPKQASLSLDDVA